MNPRLCDCRDPETNPPEEVIGTICHHTISLDGLIAGPHDSMDWLSSQGQATSLADETTARIGAILAGRT
jgi:hypothetical protein